MKRILIVASLALALASPALAQTPTPSPKPTPAPSPAPATELRVDTTLAPDFKSVDVTIGAIQRSNDTGSSKFFEYRDIPNGGVVPHLDFAGKSGDFRWQLDARDVTQKDQSYFLNAEKSGRSVRASY